MGNHMGSWVRGLGNTRFGAPSSSNSFNTLSQSKNSRRSRPGSQPELTWPGLLLQGRLPARPCFLPSHSLEPWHCQVVGTGGYWCSGRASGPWSWRWSFLGRTQSYLKPGDHDTGYSREGFCWGGILNLPPSPSLPVASTLWLRYAGRSPCADGNGGCMHICQVLRGLAYCGCHTGYQLAADRKACEGRMGTLLDGSLVDLD